MITLATPSNFSIPEWFNEKNILSLSQKISAIAIVALAFYYDAATFLAFTLIGVAISFIKTKGGCCSVNKSCSQGLFEEIMGSKLHPVASLLANLAITIGHIMHHSNIFIPIVGLYSGAWASNKAPNVYENLATSLNRV